MEVMKGYSPSDIAEQFQTTRRSVDNSIRTAVNRIVYAHNERWKACHRSENATEWTNGTLKIHTLI